MTAANSCGGAGRRPPPRAATNAKMLDNQSACPPAANALRGAPWRPNCLAALPQNTQPARALGVEWREGLPSNSPANAEIAMELAPDRYRYILERPILEPPGARWAYCGGAAALLGRLIADGTGRSLPQYGQAVLFAPLGIGSFEWMTGGGGGAPRPARL